MNHDIVFKYLEWIWQRSRFRVLNRISDEDPDYDSFATTESSYLPTVTVTVVIAATVFAKINL